MADLTTEIQRLEGIVLHLITIEQRTRKQELELTFYREELTLTRRLLADRPAPAGNYQQMYNSYFIIQLCRNILFFYFHRHSSLNRRTVVDSK